MLSPRRGVAQSEGQGQSPYRTREAPGHTILQSIYVPLHTILIYYRTAHYNIYLDGPTATGGGIGVGGSRHGCGGYLEATRGGEGTRTAAATTRVATRLPRRRRGGRGERGGRKEEGEEIGGKGLM